MFGPLGVPELIFIFVLALLIFGPRRLPEIGRTVGKAVGEFRRATTDLKRSINTEIALEEDKGKERPSKPARREVEVQVSDQGLLEPAPPGSVARESGGEEAAADALPDTPGEPAEVSAAETVDETTDEAASAEVAEPEAAGAADDEAAGDDEKTAARGD